VFHERQPFEHPEEHWQIVDTRNLCKLRLAEAMRKSKKICCVYSRMKLWLLLAGPLGHMPEDD
jgi:hypothetical protein